LDGQEVILKADSSTGGEFISTENLKGIFTLNGELSRLNSEAAIATTDMRWQALYRGTAVHSRDRAQIPEVSNDPNDNQTITLQRDRLEANITSARSIGMDVDSSIVQSQGSHKFYLSFDSQGVLANADFHTGQYEQGAHWQAGALPTAILVENKVGNGFTRYLDTSNAIMIEGKAYFISPEYEGIRGTIRSDTGEIYFGASGLPILGNYSRMEYLGNLSTNQTHDSGVQTFAKFNLDEVIRTNTTDLNVCLDSISGTI
jgi:hypothetical protein